MKVEISQTFLRLADAAPLARKLESAGCHGMLATESNHDPFLHLAAAAANTERLTLSTGVAIAFARSPLITAHMAWDIQDLSGGRLLLGLGSQVKGHIERRFGMPWSAPGPRLREYILAMRAIWDCWQNGGKLDFRGEHYTHTLMPAAWRPEPIAHPRIPVYISAVNPYMCRLVGELCDGIRVHPISSPSFTREVVLPAIAAGAQKTGRSAADIDIVCAPHIATGANEAEVAANVTLVRRSIARYASTRTYHTIFEYHGHGDLVTGLHALSLQERWEEMGEMIGDDLVEAFAIVGTYDQIAQRIKDRWGGLATRVALALPAKDLKDDAVLKDWAAKLSS